MAGLPLLYNKKLNESFLIEMSDGREDIIECVRELTDIFEEYNNAVLGIDDDYLIEAKLAGELSTNEITKLFRAASAYSKGEEPKKGMFSKMGEKAKAGKEAVQKLTQAVKSGAKKLQNTEPVQGFDTKVAEILQKWKGKLGEDNKAVKMAQQLGEFGNKHPKKTAFIIYVLSALSGAIGTPAFGMAAGTALRTAMGLAKGERASSALGKSAKAAAIGAVGGIVGDYISGDEAVQGIEAQAQEAGVPPPEQADAGIVQQNAQALANEPGGQEVMGDEQWQKYVDKYYGGNERAAWKGWEKIVDDQGGKQYLGNRLARIGIKLGG